MRLPRCAASRLRRALTWPSRSVTVWELGEVQRDNFAPRFWSSKGCLFHHAYTVGYRASKVRAVAAAGTAELR